ncbi:MAG: hypothetical protein HQK81_10645 [Desulfovibrionaceae bacterium]|nr:hypothetical protein [Desulfovibrionaceae bacterium]MBF0514500.1 hypothetical protein [Desulfovibrionaceae bacterium]
MYDFLTGPLLWLSFIVFFAGCVWRVVAYIRGLSWQLDRVAYGPHFGIGLRWALKSIGHWLLPLGSRNWRQRPLFNALFFVFHFGLLVVPIFLLAHTVVLRERFGIGWPSISNPLADALTICVLITGLFLYLRRLAFPEVRLLTGPHEIAILVIAVAPFLTGFVAAHTGPGNYAFWLNLHVICGEVMLLAIPFTKLNHFVLFFMSRGQIGMDFGIKRGGERGRGIVW